MSRSDPQFNLRIPAELKLSIEEAAQRNKRSATAEIIDRLEATIALDDYMSEHRAGTYAEVYDMLQSVWADNDRMTASGEQTFSNAYAIIDKLLDDKLAVMFALLEREEIKGVPLEQRLTASEILKHLTPAKHSEEPKVEVKYDPDMKIATTMEPIKRPVRSGRRPTKPKE